MLKTTYRLVPDEFGEGADRAAKATPRELTRLLREITERARTNIVKRSPVGHSNVLRGGYAAEVRRPNTRRPQGVVTNPIIYHDAVEEGRNAGRPPPTAALIPWVGSKLGIPPGPEREGVAFLVARAIGRRGTKPQNMVKEGWEATRKDIKPLLKEAGVRIVRRLE